LVKFLSDEWFNIARDTVTKKLDPQKDLKNATASLLNIIQHVPPDDRTLYFYLSVKNGNISEIILDDNDSLLNKNAEFVVTGNYDTFSQIIKGEMNTIIALLKNRVIIKGDKSKAMQFAIPIDKLNACLKEIETEY
jgi:putative sterol carrier protein